MVRRYREANSEAERKATAEKALARRPDSCAVIIEPKDGKQPQMLCGAKFLLVRDFTMAQVLAVIRRKLGKGVSQAEALYLFVEDPDPSTDATIPPMTHTIGTLYDEYKFPDGFMYIVYSGDEVFGA